MFHDTLTTEDAAIFQRAASRNRESLPADYMVMMGDSTDYRAMLARERYESTRKGGDCRSYLPMSAVLMEGRCGMTLREAYEKGCIL